MSLPRTSANTSACTGANLYARTRIGKVTFNGCVPYFGRAAAIIKQRERIKRQTIEYRRLQHRKLAA